MYLTQVVIIGMIGDYVTDVNVMIIHLQSFYVTSYNMKCPTTAKCVQKGLRHRKSILEKRGEIRRYTLSSSVTIICVSIFYLYRCISIQNDMPEMRRRLALSDRGRWNTQLQ